MADRGTWTFSIGGTTLCDYEDVVSNLTFDGTPVVEAVPRFRAESLIHKQRDNFALTITFGLTIEHDDNADSADFALKSAQDYSGVHDVNITHIDHTGVETSYVLYDAKVEISTADPIGVTTISQVRITGGKVEDAE